MLFSRLCSEAGLGSIRRRGDAEVCRVVADSRRVREGDCFVAVRGTVDDGHRYIASAVAAGCSAVVCEDAAAVPSKIAYAVVDDARSAAGPLAQAILGWPGRKLTITGITGTNGKTTIAYILRHILRHAGKKVALLGTIEYETIAKTAPARTTTPDPIELAGMMAETVAAGGEHLVMEVSSHALDQHRTDGIEFDTAVFTNLSGDHLDYHGSMENYFAAKRRLFESLSDSAWAVLNRDEDYSEAIVPATRASILWYGLSTAADVSGRIDGIDMNGSRFLLRTGDGEAPVQTRLIGRHNIYNCLAAAATAKVLGVDCETVAAALATAEHVPGRLQRIDAAAPFDVLVDYAHTDDALDNVLSSLKPIAAGRLILVFGCGGDRDRTKRPRMAEAAENWADEIVVTSDNPRSEDPAAIIDEIMPGFSSKGRSKVRAEPDRRAAIAAALNLAETGDVVLVAGKGHENYQVVGDKRIQFDDAEIIRKIVSGSP